MSDLGLKFSSVSLIKALFALVLSLVLSYLFSKSLYQSHTSLYIFSGKVTVPDKYINDNFYEIKSIHWENKEFVDYLELDYDKASRNLKYDLRKEFGHEPHVNIHGGDGVFLVKGRDSDKEKAKEICEKALSVVYKSWKNHFQKMKKPLIAFQENVAIALSKVREAINQNGDLLASARKNPALRSIVEERDIKLLKEKAVLETKSKHIKNVLENIKEPFILQKTTFLQKIESSKAKLIITFIVSFLFLSGVFINGLFLLKRRKKQSLK